jgi:hypothetical protein
VESGGTRAERFAWIAAAGWLHASAIAFLVLKTLGVDLNAAVFAVTMAGFTVALAALAQLLGRKRGRADFYERWIVLAREHQISVSWEQLAGYTDASADFVQLVSRGDRWPKRDLAIATATEEDRTAVLALLDAHGLERLD